MDWSDLLFMHWRVEVDWLRPLVPPALEIERFDGSAWLGIVPFVMSGTRARLTPPLPGLSRFPELNVRTYVHPASGPDQDKPGVWFFSLDATKRIAVEAARTVFSLPYFLARMSAERCDDGWVEYRHERIDSNDRLAFGRAHPGTSRFECRYRPTDQVRPAVIGSLESFLTDRYRLYSWRDGNDGGMLLAGDIHHPPWPLQPAEAQVAVNTASAFLGLGDLPGEPLLHFSRHVKVAAWRPRRVPGG